MLKIRAMGTVEEIEWLHNLLINNEKMRVLDHSEILTLQNTKRFYRMYFKVEQKENMSRGQSDGEQTKMYIRNSAYRKACLRAKEVKKEKGNV